VSLPWFIALPALKIIREFPDFEADQATGKRGLTLRLGRERSAMVYDVLLLFAVLAFVPVWFILQSPTFWLVLIPAFFLLRSVGLTIAGGWKEPDLSGCCSSRSHSRQPFSGRFFSRADKGWAKGSGVSKSKALEPVAPQSVGRNTLNGARFPCSSPCWAWPPQASSP
jgi:hypothetical protein